jgi:hypothetical protein
MMREAKFPEDENFRSQYGHVSMGIWWVSVWDSRQWQTGVMLRQLPLEVHSWPLVSPPWTHQRYLGCLLTNALKLCGQHSSAYCGMGCLRGYRLRERDVLDESLLLASR